MFWTNYIFCTDLRYIGCSYSLGTLIQAVEINEGAKRRGSGRFFEDTALAKDTSPDQMFVGFEREVLLFCS